MSDRDRQSDSESVGLNAGNETKEGPGVLLRVEGLTKNYQTENQRAVRAADSVGFSLVSGETLGLVGESGSGKSTVARCIARATTPTSGRIWFRLRDGTWVDLAALSERALRPIRREVQMIFQDPQASLDPRMRVRDIVAEPLVVHRLARGSELEGRVEEILLRVGLKTEHLSRFPAAFSTGQRQRIGIARALILRPSLVIADEPVSTLDVSVQAQVLNLLKDLQSEFQLTYLFVAHNLDVVRHFCDRVAVMYAGRMVEEAPTRALFAYPRHPYTEALLAAVPLADPDVPMIPLGDLPRVDLAHIPAGCAYRPRCTSASRRCEEERPELWPLDGTPRQLAACHHPRAAGSTL